MTIDEFFSNLVKEAQNFRAYWTHNHFENPQAFPLELNAIEFNEQFRMWKDFIK